MKMSFLKNVICAAIVATVGLTACQSTPPEDVNVVIVEKDAMASMLDASVQPAKEQLKPGCAYMTKETRERISVRFPFDLEFTQVGLTRTRINADTAELSFFEWGWDPKGAYEITSRLVWFDKSGKLVTVDKPRVHRVMPSDPVRFSATALDESSKNVSIILDCKR